MFNSSIKKIYTYLLTKRVIESWSDRIGERVDRIVE